MTEYREKNFTEKASLIILALLLTALCIYGLIDHKARLGNDEHNHVTFARNLAHGRLFYDVPIVSVFNDIYPADKAIYVYYGGERMNNGRIFSKIEIGSPILLALALRLFGEDAMFLVTPFFLVLLTLFVFLSARELFYYEKYRNSIGVLASMLIIFLNTEIVRYSRVPLRDIPSMAFLAASIYFLIRSMRDISRIGWLYFGAAIFLFGFSCTTRITNIVMLLPYGIYIAFSAARRGGFKGMLAATGLSAVCFTAGLAPLILQNYMTSGNPFVPPQSPEAVGLMPFLPAERCGLGLDASNFAYKIQQVPEWFLSVYPWILIAFLIIGIVLSWRRFEAKILYLLSPLVFFALFCMWGTKLKAKYFIFVHPYLATLVAYGAIRLFAIKWGKVERFLKPVTNAGTRIMFIIGFAFALTINSLVQDIESNKTEGSFGVSEARLFKQGIEKLVPKGSVVFAARYLSPNIDFYTHAWSLSPQQLSSPWNISDKEAIEILLDKGYPLYIFNNLAVQNAATWVEEIKQDFDLVRISETRSKDLGIAYNDVSRRPYLSLYKIERWSKKEIALELDTLYKTDYVLTCDLRNVWSESRPERKVSIILNEQPIDGQLRNGVNFIYLPKEKISAPSSEFKIIADIGMPQEIYVRLQPLQSDYLIDIGSEHEDKDALFVSRDMLEEGINANRFRIIGDRSTIALPTITAKNMRIGLKLSVSSQKTADGKLAPAIIHMDLDGKEFSTIEVEKSNNNKTISAMIPSKFITSEVSKLGLHIKCKGNEFGKGGDTLSLGLDWIKVEHWTDSIGYDVVLPADSNGAAILLVEAKGIVSGEKEGIPIYLKAGEAEFQSNLVNGANWIVLPRTVMESDSLGIRISSTPFGDGILVRYIDSFAIGRIYEIDTGGNDDVYIIDGFHQKEYFNSQQSARWTKGNARIRIPCFDQTEQHVLEICFIPQPKSIGGIKASFSVNGTEIGAAEISAEEFQKVKVNVPQGLLHIGWNELTISTPVWKPSEKLGTEDIRELGVMIDKIRIDFGRTVSPAAGK